MPLVDDYAESTPSASFCDIPFLKSAH